MAGKCGARGWSVVQLDFDEELGLFAWDVWLNGGRIRGPAYHQEEGADGLPLSVKKVIAPIKVHVVNKGITDVLWRGERKCIKPKAGDADLWIRIWLGRIALAARDIVVEVQHVLAHRTKTDKKEMSHFGKFVRSNVGRRIPWP